MQGGCAPLTDEQCREVADAYKAASNVKAEAARALGVPRETFCARLKVATRRGFVKPFDPPMPGFEITQASVKVGDAWVTQKPEHGEVFKVPEGQFLKRVSHLGDAEGRTIVQWSITDQDKEATLVKLRTIVDALKADLPRVTPTKAPDHCNALLANQYTLTDLHFGMMAWQEETRNASYDLKIAEKLLLDWFSAAIAMSPNAEVGILAQLGDLMHHDALESVTPAHKHVLDADSRLQKIIRIVISTVRQIIAMLLEKHERVHVVMAQGNHDPASSAWIRELLCALYENEPRITIDNSPDVYYAFEWGKTALFYHHGHKRDLKDVDSVFAGKFREIFGRCPKSYGHVGHKHCDEAKEGNLMRIERHRTLAPPDAHASSGGWLSERDAKVITYHREFGEVFRSILSPEMVTAQPEQIT
jgi:hypothetical protein